MQWSKGVYAGFSTVAPDILVNSNYREVNVETQEQNPDSILNYYRKAIALRKQEDILDTILDGRFDLIDASHEDVFAYVHHGDKPLVVIANFRSCDVSFAFPYANMSSKILLKNYHDREKLSSKLSLRPFEVMLIQFTEAI